jgi:UDP-N-acetylmuramoyl-L-alanyl-D-glutamate--2,6-diaminopimelate ligase
MDLSALVAGLDVRVVGGGAEVSDLTEDSRTVLPGSLFVARRGLRSDGRSFIAQAVRDGASAVLTDEPSAGDVPRGVPAVIAGDVALATAQLAERFFGSPSSGLTLIGVTGTNGKTTVAHLVHGLLNASGVRCGLIGTVAIDDGRETAESEMTTLPAIELSRTLATMAEHGCRAAVMEVSSHALDQRRADALSFDVAVFTALGRDHLDYHGTVERYAAAKARLFGLLGAEGLAIVNADDPAHREMLRGCRARVLRCSRVSGDASVAAEPRGVSGMSLSMRGPFGAIAAELAMLGGHNAMNALQAVCAAHAAGAASESIARAIRTPTPPPGRLERVPVDGADVTVLVDYAHTPDALEHTLSAVRSAMASGRLHVVFGCGGERDAGKRPLMGEAAARLADAVVLTSDNPRREKPGEIIAQVIEGVPAGARPRVTVHAERERAIEAAVLAAEPGDVIILAGKGHERTQTLPDGRGGVRVRAFDDREHARAALRRRLTAAHA